MSLAPQENVTSIEGFVLGPNLGCISHLRRWAQRIRDLRSIVDAARHDAGDALGNALTEQSDWMIDHGPDLAAIVETLAKVYETDLDTKLPLDDAEELAELRGRLRTQDNACTVWPVFTVQELRRIQGMDSDYASDYEWFDDEAQETCDEETCATLEKDYDEGEDIPERYRRVYYKDDYVHVASFLTNGAAQAFMNAHSHRLREPRIYIESAHSNPEWQLVVRTLLNPPRGEFVPYAGSNYTFGQLLVRAIRGAGRRSNDRMIRWAHVQDIFQTGSTTATELCTYAGVNPNDYLGGVEREHLDDRDEALQLAAPLTGATTAVEAVQILTRRLQEAEAQSKAG